MIRTRYDAVSRSVVQLTLATAIGLASASPAAAQSFSDGDFATGWTQATYVNPYSCSGGSQSVYATGGSPDAYLGVVNYSCSFVHNANLSPFTWNPSTQGEITGLTVSTDLTASGPMAFLAVLRQSGNYFVKNATTVYSPGWVSWSETGLSGWCELYPAWSLNGNYSCGSNQIDFTTSGSTIEFGIASANSGGSYYSQSGGIDNFGVDLATIAPAVVATPEPASMLLLATGLVGIGVIKRRRSNTGVSA